MIALHDRIIIRPLFDPVETANGIRIVDLNRGGPIRGEVVSTGSGRLLDDGSTQPPSVQCGDIVLIDNNSGSEFQNTEGTFRVIRDVDVIAIMDRGSE